MNARNQYPLTGSAPEMYERNMVPAIFAPFAKGLLEFANLLAGEARPRCGVWYWDCRPSRLALGGTLGPRSWPGCQCRDA
jgi:hypothetical protein